MNLSQIQVESDSAHFAAHRAPLRKMKFTESSSPDLGVFQRLLFEELKSFQKRLSQYEEAGLKMNEMTGFQFFRALLGQCSEFILIQKTRQKPLLRREIQSLLAMLSQNPAARTYLKGAKKLIHFEQNEALSDAELYYLSLNPDKEVDWGNSYYQKRIETLLKQLDQELDFGLKQSGQRTSLLAIATGFVLGWLGLNGL